MTEVITEDDFENIPFEEQAKYGHIRSFFLTVIMLIRTPSGFFRKMHINKGLKLPFLFMLIVLTFSNIMNYIFIAYDITDSPAEQVISAFEKDPQFQTQADNFRSMFSSEPEVFDVFTSVIINFLLIFLIAVYWHFILRSLKIALNGLEATIRVFCYSTVVLITSIIPLNNPYINFAVYIWWTLIMFRGISEAHEISANLVWRGITVALFATLIPFILIIAAVF